MLNYFLVLSVIFSVGSSVEWDYLTYTLAWPQTFCKYNKCEYPKTQVTGWNIHGLWPSSSTGEDPYNCSPIPFNEDDIKSIYSDLLVQWANLLDFNEPKEFWTHEWSKHGTCSLSDPAFPSQLSYFQNGLILKSNASIDKIFSDNNIIPSFETTYDTAIVTSSIFNKLHITPKLECVKIDEAYYLSAIEICFNKNLKPIDCPKHHHENIENPLKDLVHEVFQRIIEYPFINQRKPVNSICGEHPFYLPL